MNFCATCSCVVKVVEPQAGATVDDLKAVVSKVKILEDERRIPPWDDEHVPEEIVLEKPSPGWFFLAFVLEWFYHILQNLHSSSIFYLVLESKSMLPLTSFFASHGCYPGREEKRCHCLPVQLDSSFLLIDISSG